MCRFSANDLASIQECLDSYYKLIKWFPAISPEDRAMKEDRLEIIEHLSRKCEIEIRRMSNE